MVCRICLQLPDNALLLFFGEDGAERRITEVLKKLSLCSCIDDTLSNVICEKCWQKLSDFHDFYQTVEKAHREQHGMKVSEINLAVELVETVYDVKCEEEVEYINTKATINDIPVVDNDAEGEAAVNPLYEPEVPEQIDIKAETSEADNLEGTNLKASSDEGSEVSSESGGSEEDDNSDYEPEKSSTPPSPTYSVGVRTRKRVRESTSASKALLKSAKKPKKLKSKTIIKKKKQEKRCWTTPLDDEMVRKHLPLNCELCGLVVDTYTSMIKHFRVAHRDSRPYIRCCGRRLSKRQRVVQHAYHHEDPNYFQCEICKKNFSDNYVLRSHMLAHHPAEDELTHQCDQCEKRFSRRYLLELHKPVHIPVEERKFICTKCPTPKAFASDHLRQIHDNMRHKRATNVCHVCAKEIRDNQAFEKHVRSHFEDSGPRVKCPRPDCDRWLKDDDNLKQHLRRHNDEGKIITCGECGKSVKNRRALSSHMSYAHSKALFSCEECKKTFKKAITLKEHMAQHTGVTLYKCPFCPRTFNSNANMHSHKKKMHPVEWDVWRRTKTGSSQHTKSNKQVLEAVANNTLNNRTQSIAPIISIQSEHQQQQPQQPIPISLPILFLPLPEGGNLL